MSAKYDRLVELLSQLFQLDQPDLDFGLYRIMHAKSAEVTRFLQKDLLSQIRTAFAEHEKADKAAQQAKLEELKAGAEEPGTNPADSPKIRELEHQLAESADLEQLEGEVYDHLYSFFRRYYDAGDFISKRVYKDGVYAIPYAGEEVKLHWANADQYYIKTSEYLRDYTFRLRPHDEENPMRVHFRLKDATEGEHDNVKASGNMRRVFVLAEENFISEEIGEEGGKELSILFEYRPSGGGKQSDLLQHAEDKIRTSTDENFAAWLVDLLRPHTTSDGKQADYSRLRAHLNRYTARNTFDYFIHKDLGGFLRRELDFYIKNEIMHLDDIESARAERVEQYLSKIKVLRSIAGKIIDFLAQLENFQKKLWLKKKFVVSSEFVLSLRTLRPVLDATQYAHWVAEVRQLLKNSSGFRADVERAIRDTFKRPANNVYVRDIKFSEQEIQFNYKKLEKAKTGVVPSPHKSEKLAKSLSYDDLYIDSKFLSSIQKEQILEQATTASDLINIENGVLVKAECSQALDFISARYRECIDSVYMDPPYNTGNDGFLYKDSYSHSSWLAMMHDKVASARRLLKNSGSFYLSIDWNEAHRARSLLEQIFGAENFQREIIWNTGDNISGFKSLAPNWIRQHDTIYFYSRNHNFLKFRKLWQATRKEGSRGWLDFIGKKENLFIEIWNMGEFQKNPISAKVKALGDIWNKIYSFQYSEPRVTESWFFKTQKVENLLRRIIQSSTDPNDIVLDSFFGSGTTCATAHKLGRKWLGIEMSEVFEKTAVPRMKTVLLGEKRSHLSADLGWEGGGMFRYIQLESYEDTLNNLHLQRTDAQQKLLANPDTTVHEQYMLRYLLDVETQNSPSLLNLLTFQDPTAYKLRVKLSGSDESRETNVDLLETFNWLIGLTVHRIMAPQSFRAAFQTDTEKRLQLKGELESDSDGPYWFRAVTGSVPDGRSALIIWRKLTGDPGKDNLVLDTWFQKQGYADEDCPFHLIYVNGGSNLESLRPDGVSWVLRLIEEDFHRLMFEEEIF